ncbi:MAG: hypothetical protein NTU61_00945 [Candidatus Altiarchaeota archaeon]|nr:hypothetical protein [Candidatus Altiarchaeota archaeon]
MWLVPELLPLPLFELAELAMLARKLDVVAVLPLEDEAVEDFAYDDEALAGFALTTIVSLSLPVDVALLL